MSKDLKLGRQRDSDGGLLEEKRSLQREEPWQRLSGGSVPSRVWGRENRGAVGDEGGEVTGMGWPDHVGRQMDFGFDFQ